MGSTPMGTYWKPMMLGKKPTKIEHFGLNSVNDISRSKLRSINSASTSIHKITFPNLNL